MIRDKEINIRVGRGTQGGKVGISTFLPDALTLRVSYKGGQAVTVALTEEQVLQLRQALEEIAPHAEAQSEKKLRLVA